jgi:SAM-dependent methyltransferase
MKGSAWLRRVARRSPLSSRRARRTFYGESYFEGSGVRGDGSSGYGGYDRDLSNANVAAYLLWRFIPFTTSLDVGCAKGYVVEALTELGHDSYGWDVSEWAIADAAPAVAGRLAVADLERRLPGHRPHDRFSLVSALEVLEHVKPARVPHALKQLRSICDGYLVATIPSLGANPSGPGGFPDGKVRPERLEHYRELGLAYDGPVPYEDLARDERDLPIQGHIAVASFRWWTEQFEAAGFRRLGDVEMAMHPVIGRFDLSVAWNLYVFHVDSKEPAPAPVRTEEELTELEQRWHLADREPGDHSIHLTQISVGDQAVKAIYAEIEASRARRAEA